MGIQVDKKEKNQRKNLRQKEDQENTIKQMDFEYKIFTGNWFDHD